MTASNSGTSTGLGTCRRSRVQGFSSVLCSRSPLRCFGHSMGRRPGPGMGAGREFMPDCHPLVEVDGQNVTRMYH
jgi:hypothetical protein